MATAAEPVIDDDVPYSDAVYPQELIDEWDRESDLIEQTIENGEEVKSIEEQFAEHGYRVQTTPSNRVGGG